MRWGRIALYFFVAIVAVLAISIALAFTMDLGRFKSNAEVFVSELLNRKLSINGPLHLNLGRSIELSAEDVSLAGTDWSAESNIASVGLIKASVNTWSLISGPIMIESLELDGVRISLEHNDAGENNWTFFEPKEETADKVESDERPRMPVFADNIRISDLELVYDNPRRARPFEFSATLIEEKIVDDRVQLTLTGDINETPVTLNVSAGRVEDLLEFGEVDFGLEGNLGEIELSGEAHVSDLLHPGKPSMRLSIAGPNVEYLTDRLRLKRITTGPLSLEINVAPSNSNQQLSVHGDIGEFKVIANGQFVDLQRLDEMELNLSASGPDASALGDIVGLKNVPTDPFSVVGQFKRSGSNIVIEGVTVTVGAIRFDLQANIKDFRHASGANGTLRLSGPDIGHFTKLVGAPGHLNGPFELEADLAALDGGGATVNLRASNSGLVLAVKGNIVDDEKWIGTDVQIHFAGPSLRTVTDVAGLNAAPDEPFSLDAGIVRVVDGLVIDGGSFSLGGHLLSFDGLIGNRPLENGTDISFDLAGPDFAGLLDAFGRDADELPYAQYKMSGRIERIPEHYVLHDVVAEIGADNEYAFGIDGIVTDQPRLLGTRIRVNVRGASIGAITDAAGMEGFPKKPFDVAANVEFVEKGYSIKQGRAQLGDSNIVLNGLVGYEPLSEDSNLEFEAATPSLKTTLANFNIEIPRLPEGELLVSGAIRSQGKGFALQDVAVTFAGATANIKGMLGGLPTFDGTDIQLDVSGNDLSRLLPPVEAVKGLNKPFSVNAEISLSGDTLKISSAKIQIDQTRFAMDMDFGLDPLLGHGEFSIQGESPDVLVLYPQAAELTAHDTAPMEIAVIAHWSDNLWTISKFDLSLSSGRIVIDGIIDGPPNFDKTDLNFDWHISSLDNFDLIAGRELPDLPAYLTFHVEGTPEVVTVEDIDVQIGESDLSGEFSFRDGDVPAVEINLFSSRLNLSPFMPSEPEAPPAPPPPQANDKNRKLLPDTPISVDVLHEIQASVNIRVDEINMQERTFRDFVLRGGIADGRMQIGEISVKTSRGGEFTGRLGLQQKDDGVEAGIRLFGNALTFGLPADTEEELNRLPLYELDLALISEGKTVGELAGALNGYLRMVGGEGQIRAGELAAFTNDFLFELLNTINPFASKNPYTNLGCVAILATVENGQVKGKPMLVVQSDNLKIIANTEIDLKSEKLDIRFNVVPQKGLGISLSSLVNPYVKVGGTLANPTLTMDTESALIQGSAAVATAGLSILAKSLADRFLSAKDPCGKAVSAADEQFRLLLEKYGRSGTAEQP